MANDARSLHLICGKEETLDEAKRILSVAKSKTGPGSGHHLGKNSNALPPICAFLASERLGNNDVVKPVAQQAACLAPKNFEMVLSIVRGALVSYFEERKRTGVSYEGLCKSHGLDDDALYWMEQIDKKMRDSKELNDYGVDGDLVTCAVFYWTCVALNTGRGLNSNELVTKYGIQRGTFKDVLEIMDDKCKSFRLKIDKFLTENVGTSTTTTPRRKRHGASTVSTPVKTPVRFADGVSDINLSPTKRKVALPPLHFMTPKRKITSPVKLNRLPVGSNAASTPSRRKDTSVGVTPVKPYVSQGSLPVTPSKHAVAGERCETEPEEGHFVAAAQPKRKVTIVHEPASDLSHTESNDESSGIPPTPSPHKSARRKATVPDETTPVAKKARLRPSSPTPTAKLRSSPSRRVHEEPPSSESSEDEAEGPLCRHPSTIFADRAFYHYRDPRVVREWEACERFLKEHGLSYAQVRVR